jgi:hypothetical protein
MVGKGCPVGGLALFSLPKIIEDFLRFFGIIGG